MNDEDEEIQSRSPSQSPPPNGRITVPVVPPSPPSSSPPPPPSLALALPTQQPRPSNGSGGGGGREDCWSEGATEILIDAWGERYLELSRGNLKQKHWQEVADIVSSRNGYKKTPKTDVQCKNRIDTVKKKYKVEKAKIAAGGVSSWALFDKLDGLIGPMGKSPLPSANKVGPSSQKKKRKRKKVESEDEDEEEEEEEEEEGFDSEDDGFPPPRKTMAVVKREDVGASAGAVKERNSVRVLTEAMLRFGEVYERAESAKLAQVVEMEKARMRFVKELELQRMQFFTKMQMEISQLRKRGGGGIGNNHNHHRRHRRHYHDGNNVGMDKNGSDSDN